MITNKKNNLIKLILIYLLVIVILFLYLYLSQRKILYVPCLFNKITKLYCPGCGMTRAAISFMKFDIIECLKNNLLFLSLLPIIIYLLIKESIYFYKNNHLITINYFLSNFKIYTILIITILFGIIRNLPTFNWLQPL